MDATQEFWMSEDLLEHLLPMLDLVTTLNLAFVNPLVVSLLRRPAAWHHFLERSYKPANLFPQEFEVSQQITLLLKMMEDDEEQLLLHLLDFICEMFKMPCREQLKSSLGMDSIKVREIKLNLKGNSKLVFLDGFVILQHVVSSLESKVMTVEEVTLEKGEMERGSLPPEERLRFEKALALQMSRQQFEAKVHFQELSLSSKGSIDPWDDKNDIKSIITILKNSSSWTVNKLKLEGLDESVWGSLAEVAHKGSISDVRVTASDLHCSEALRKIFGATTGTWLVTGVEGYSLSKSTKERNLYLGLFEQSQVQTVICVRGGEGAEGWARIQEIIMENEKNDTRNPKEEAK